tara:strand:+ start:7945 stop:8178 length:234 start_codon:yes stop_codon:yes gene_type:complete
MHNVLKWAKSKKGFVGWVLVILAAIALVLALLAAIPLLTIWSLNSLFGLGIDVNGYTLMSAFWLLVLFASNAVRGNK